MEDFVLDPIHALPLVAPSRRSNGVDLWCFYYKQICDSALFGAYEKLMTADEEVRYRSLHFKRDRLIFLATRALVRTVLSAYVDVPARLWRFAEGVRGKPYIKEPTGIPPLYFNLSNTCGLIVCAVSRNHDQIGVDAEWLDREGETVSLADRHFSLTEIRALHALPTALRRARFFRYWTLKESYIKARGLGLALPLEQFTFLLGGTPTIRIEFDPRLGDDPRRWRFALLSASRSHIVAVAVDTGGHPLVLSASNHVPLHGTFPFERSSS